MAVVLLLGGGPLHPAQPLGTWGTWGHAVWETLLSRAAPAVGVEGRGCPQGLMLSMWAFKWPPSPHLFSPGKWSFFLRCRAFPWGIPKCRGDFAVSWKEKLITVSPHCGLSSSKVLEQQTWCIRQTIICLFPDVAGFYSLPPSQFFSK